MTEVGADPWPTEPLGPYSSEPTGGHATATVDLTSPRPAPPLAAPTVVTSPPVVLSPGPTTAEPANREMHWNWAAGCVIGLAILCLVFAAPRFAVAVDTGQLGQQHLGDWLLYGAALGSLLTMICLASREVVVVATLSLITAAVAIGAVIKLQGDWHLTDNSTWASLGLVIGLGVLGLGSSVGLRRRS